LLFPYFQISDLIFIRFLPGTKLQGITRTEGIQITVLWIFFTVERLLVRNESHSDLF